jgi:transcriptional regulator with XRE-family HTH domain
VTDGHLRTASDLFDPTRLRIARQAAMLHKKDLAERLGISAGAVSQYENGSSSPSPKIVAGLALALGVPSNFFASDRPLGEAPATTAHFRSLRSTSKQERDRAFAHALLTWELTGVIERYVRLPSYNLPTDLSIGADDPPSAVEVAAQRARTVLELGTGPLSNTVRLLESRGVVCTRLPALTRRVFAFSCDFPSRPVVVSMRPTNSDTCCCTTTRNPAPMPWNVRPTSLPPSSWRPPARSPICSRREWTGSDSCSSRRHGESPCKRCSSERGR